MQVAGPALAWAGRRPTGDDLAIAHGRVDPQRIGPPGTVLLWIDQSDPIPPPAENVTGDLLQWESHPTPNRTRRRPARSGELGA